MVDKGRVSLHMCAQFGVTEPQCCGPDSQRQSPHSKIEFNRLASTLLTRHAWKGAWNCCEPQLFCIARSSTTPDYPATLIWNLAA